MQRYESYKNSDAGWLGDIPSQWELKRLKYSVELINQKIPCTRADEYVGLENIESWTGKNIAGSQDSPPESQTNAFQKNDVLFGKLRPYLAKVWLADRDGYSSTELLALRTQEYLPGYLRYLCISKSFINAVDGSTFGSKMPRADWSFIGNLDTPIPTKDEQNRIVIVLDQKTLEIDCAIAKKKQLINLLEEQKSILGNHAVTQGLAKNVPMHESGVKWIGTVPAKWNVKRAKFLFREIDERSQTGNEELLSVSHITGVTSRSEKTNIYMFMAEDYTGSKLCRPDDLVFNIMWAWMGALGVSDKAGIVSPSYGVYRQRMEGTFNNWYLENLLRSTAYVAEYNRRSTGLHSSRLRLYSNMFFDMEIAVPPREEQDEIERRTKERVDKADAVIGATQLEIEKLVEFRATLIESYVTGKIRA